jgi:hypothetical protein
MSFEWKMHDMNKGCVILFQLQYLQSRDLDYYEYRVCGMANFCHFVN